MILCGSSGPCELKICLPLSLRVTFYSLLKLEFGNSGIFRKHWNYKGIANPKKPYDMEGNISTFGLKYT